MSKQEKLISADKLLKWIDSEEASVLWEDPYGIDKYQLVIGEIKAGTFNPDPVPTIKPGDIISDLLFAFINKDADCPHDFEVKAFEDAVTYLRDHDQLRKYNSELFEGYLQLMRER